MYEQTEKDCHASNNAMRDVIQNSETGWDNIFNLRKKENKEKQKGKQKKSLKPCVCPP